MKARIFPPEPEKRKIAAGLAMASALCLSLAAVVEAAPMKVLPAKTSGDAVFSLMIDFARRPELLEGAYLRRILGGADDRGRNIMGRLNMHYSRLVEPGTSYDFVDSDTVAATAYGASPRTCSHRQLVCHLKSSGLTLAEVRRRLGQPERRYFDRNSHPVDVYRFSPHASLSITEPVNSFDVNQIEVNYVGDDLPAPSLQDMALADTYRLEKARLLLASGGSRIDTACQLLTEHLQDNPNDRQAHLIYASILRRLSDVNGAMDHYRTALSLSRQVGDSQAEQRALNGLSEFGVVVGADTGKPLNGTYKTSAAPVRPPAYSGSVVPKHSPAGKKPEISPDAARAMLAGTQQPF